MSCMITTLTVPPTQGFGVDGFGFAGTTLHQMRHINVLTGPSGVGKTTVLSAAYYHAQNHVRGPVVRLDGHQLLTQDVRDSLGYRRALKMARSHLSQWPAHRSLADALAMGECGEGLRRAFDMGVLINAAAGGVLLIDDFERSMHPTLQADMVGLLSELSTLLGVQIILSTHSDVVIDTLVRNDSGEGVAVYAMVRSAKAVVARRYSSATIARLSEAVDFDVRYVVL